MANDEQQSQNNLNEQAKMKVEKQEGGFAKNEEQEKITPICGQQKMCNQKSRRQLQ